MKNRTTYRNKRHNTKVAHVDKIGHDEYVVSVWHDNGNVAARWFKGHSTCLNTYKSFRAAEQAARKFLSV